MLAEAAFSWGYALHTTRKVFVFPFVTWPATYKVSLNECGYTIKNDQILPRLDRNNGMKERKKLHSPALAGPQLCPEDLWTRMAVNTGRAHQGAAHLSIGRVGSRDWKQGVELTSSAWCREDDTDPPELCARAHAPAASKTEVMIL